MTASMARQGPFLLVRVSGFHTPGPVPGIVTAIRGELERLGLDRLLLDLRGLVGLVTASDHRADAEQMVDRLRGIRWATLVRRDQYSGKGRALCIDQGCEMDTFFDEALAREWLASDRPGGARDRTLKGLDCGAAGAKG